MPLPYILRPATSICQSVCPLNKRKKEKMGGKRALEQPWVQPPLQLDCWKKSGKRALELPQVQTPQRRSLRALVPKVALTQNF